MDFASKEKTHNILHHTRNPSPDMLNVRLLDIAVIGDIFSHSGNNVNRLTERIVSREIYLKTNCSTSERYDFVNRDINVI